MEPQELQLYTIAAVGSEGSGALDTMVARIQDFASECVPDVGRAREALDAWGIVHKEGEPIRQLMHSTPSLAVVLPDGWSISREGNGHVRLLDARGAARLKWYVHGWERIDVTVRERFRVRVIELSAAEDVVQVLDGETVIHTVPVVYPHVRLTRRHHDGTLYFMDGREHPEEGGWTREMQDANYATTRDAREAGGAWLDEKRAGHHDYIRAWTL